MVIEGGCSWIQLHLPHHSDSELRDLASQLIPLCKESETILMLEDRPELAKELGLHGVHITINSGLDPLKIREDFGPEAIIGIEVDNVERILTLQKADIDYVTLPESISDNRRVEITNAALINKNILPIVYKGAYSVDSVSQALLTGASGVCTGSFMINDEDPVEYTRQMIQRLNNYKL